MNRAKKAVITIIIDLVLVVLVVAAVILLIKGNASQIMKSILTWGIVVIIPIGFGITCWNIVGDRYDKLEELYPEDRDEDTEKAHAEDACAEHICAEEKQIS